MPFITQGKTNLKYILIVVVLAVVASGGILGYQYLWMPKEEIAKEEITEEKIDKCKEIQDLDSRDNCYFEVALEVKDEYYCSKMSSWYGLVSSRNCLKCLAAHKNDLTLCPENEFCPRDVFLQNTELCEDIKIDMIAECRYCYLGSLGSKECNLENTKIDEKEKCIKNIAIETGDFELCKKIGGVIADQCQNELAIKLNKPEMCFGVSCREELAIINNDVKLCEGIYHMEECIANVALHYNNPDLCKEPSEKESQDKCYYIFGIETGKEGSCELCEKISNQIAQRFCMLEVAVTVKDDGFCEKLDINIEDLTTKYTDEEFSFSFYYPEAFELSEEDNEIFLGGSYTDPITITKYLGQRVENSSAKFGKVVYYFDNDKNQWMIDDHSDLFIWDDPDYQEGIRPAKPEFYTSTGLPVFTGTGRWKTNIVALSHDKFLIINISGGGFTAPLDPLTKTVTKIDQKIEDKELKRLLIEEILSLETIF